MTRERLSELLTAVPELTVDEVKRLHGYQPRRLIVFLSVRLAYMR